MLTLLMVTKKMFGDEIIKATYYAKVLNISAQELLELEFEFMDLLEFKIHINDDEFEPYKERMRNFWEENNHNFGYSRIEKN